jgi:hypothetical protein
MAHQNTLAAKTVSDYVSTPEIDKLTQQFGAHLERVTAQAKCLMAAALLDHMAAENCSYYPIESSLESVDPDPPKKSFRTLRAKFKTSAADVSIAPLQPQVSAGCVHLNLVFSCMVIAAGLFIFLNIQPYIRAVELLANQALNYSLIQFVMSLPVIGWLLGTIASIATTIIGVALWGIFQFFELLPWILTRDADTLRSLIERIEEFEVLTVKPSDSPMVAALKERHNNIRSSGSPKQPPTPPSPMRSMG